MLRKILLNFVVDCDKSVEKMTDRIVALTYCERLVIGCVS